MHVLIATDGTAESEFALETAAEMYGTEADYTVVSVGQPRPAYLASPFGLRPSYLNVTALTGHGDGALATATETARDAAETLPADSNVELVADVGGAGASICRTADEVGADVIVVGFHERGWLTRLLEPSTSAYVIDNAPCHVLVARSRSAGAHGAA